MDRIEAPRNQRSRDTRAAILDAAWRLLEQEGGAAPSMSAVAEAAGVSRRGLYLHFTSRGQLFVELLDHIDESLDLEASARPVIEAPNAVAALDAFARHVADYHSQLIGIMRAVDRLRSDDPDAQALWRRAMRNWYGACEVLTAALASQGTLAEPWTPETAADLLWALMSVELVDDLTRDRGWSTDELTERLALLIRRTLVRDEPHA
jgi:AcrR family transcriptional regulator